MFAYRLRNKSNKVWGHAIHEIFKYTETVAQYKYDETL